MPLKSYFSNLLSKIILSLKNLSLKGFSMKGLPSKPLHLFTERKYIAVTGATLILIIVALAAISRGCGGDKGKLDSSKPPPIVRIYKLPAEHPDNTNPLKEKFFNEPLKDIKGADITLANFRGTSMVILMFPSFRTEDGQKGLVLLEKIQRERAGQFQGVVLPMEGSDVIKPEIVKDPASMWFLFRRDGKPNSTLLDRYSSLFWNEPVIRQDFPNEPPETHRASPFFWVVDRDGNIREKLVDYSAKTGVQEADLNMVLDALLGPVPAPSKTAGTKSKSKGAGK
jgi:hypothetical protein